MSKQNFEQWWDQHGGIYKFPDTDAPLTQIKSGAAAAFAAGENAAQQENQTLRDEIRKLRDHNRSLLEAWEGPHPPPDALASPATERPDAAITAAAQSLHSHLLKSHASAVVGVGYDDARPAIFVYGVPAKDVKPIVAWMGFPVVARGGKPVPALAVEAPAAAVVGQTEPTERIAQIQQRLAAWRENCAEEGGNQDFVAIFEAHAADDIAWLLNHIGATPDAQGDKEPR